MDVIPRVRVLDGEYHGTLLLQPQFLLDPPKVLWRWSGDLVRKQDLVVALLVVVGRVGSFVSG